MEREEVAGNRAHTVAAIVAGLALGMLTSIFALTVGGGGHGIDSALLTVSSLIFAPAACLTFLGRRNHTGKIAAAMMAVIAIGFDVFLWTEVADEGVFEKAWNAIPGPVAIWIALWSAWQLLLLATVFWPRKQHS